MMHIFPGVLHRKQQAIMFMQEDRQKHQNGQVLEEHQIQTSWKRTCIKDVLMSLKLFHTLPVMT